MKKLNLGCGEDYRKDWVNLDVVEEVNPDIVHNLNEFPYPFNKNEFDFILANNVLEHLDNVVKTVNELHRILVPGGYLKIRVPHVSDADTSFADPTHKNHFSLNTFDYWWEGSRKESNSSHYTSKKYKFEIIYKKLKYSFFELRFKPDSLILRFLEKIASNFYPINNIEILLKKME